MTLEKIALTTELIDDNTIIYIRDDGFHFKKFGNWYQDNVLDHMQDEIEWFAWQDDNKIYIDLK